MTRIEVPGFSFMLHLTRADLTWPYAGDTGTVRPDWICMRVVSLESPLKGHQPLYVFNFIFDLEYLKQLQSSEPLHAKGLQSSCLLGSRFACAQAATFFVKLYSINAGETSIVLWIAACR
jgi:hypothetical protein